MKLSVHLVTWNGAKYVPFLFESLRKQTFTDWHLYILDNNSADGTVAAIEKELVDFPISHTFYKLSENTGFAGGHNRLYKETKSKYFLPLNQDMYLEPDCLLKLIDFMENHQDVGSLSPRLMRWNFAQVEEGNLSNSFTDQVDTLGLRVYRNRRVVDQYGLQAWGKLKEQFSEDSLEVFGNSGALPLFRKKAIDAVAFSDRTFFDESYHSYKEDVDLAYRLRSAGFQSFVLLSAVTYHDRSAAGPEGGMSDMAASKNKKQQSSWVKYHSYKNHLMTLYKNEYWQNILLDFPWILWYELRKLIWFLLFDRSVLKGLGEMWRLRKAIRDRKLEIRRKRVVGWREMRVWWR